MKITANEFTTALPAGWQDRTMVTLIAPFRPDGFAANVVITHHEVGGRESLEEFVLEQRSIMEESLTEFELLDYRADSLNGNPCCQQLHRFTTESGVIQQVQTFVLCNEKVYVITGSAAVADFDSQIPAFREIVENFRIVE